ncbi:MAG: FtsQ-type POTRA domain-containing protein [Acidobacteriota bacterium]|nr:FtsQ-type POTRA domain-containing protein [Acidobacteriota bacterium]
MNDPLRKVRKQRKPDARRRRPPKALPFLLAGAGLLAVLLLALGVRAVVLSATLRCHRIQVAGCQRLDESRLRDVASGQLGRPLLLIDLDRVRSEIEALPTVRRAIVARHFPDLLDLQIEERQAVARCRPGGGPPRLVDTEGYLFPPPEPANPATRTCRECADCAPMPKPAAWWRRTGRPCGPSTRWSGSPGGGFPPEPSSTFHRRTASSSSRVMDPWCCGSTVSTQRPTWKNSLPGNGK